MPRITVEYAVKSGQSKGDAFDAARALLETEKAKVSAETDRRLVFARYPEWRDEGHRLIAILPYDD